MERSGFAPVAVVGFGAFMLGALMFGGAATAGAASVGAAVMWPVFALFKLVLFFLLLGFVARMFMGRGPGHHRHRYGGDGPRGRFGPPGRGEWGGPWAPWAMEGRRGDRDSDDEHDEGAPTDPRAWFEQRAEDWHLKAHARMDIDREVPDPTRDEPDGRSIA